MKWKIGDVTITKITEIVYPEFSDVIPGRHPGRGQDRPLAVAPFRDGRGHAEPEHSFADRRYAGRQAGGRYLHRQ